MAKRPISREYRIYLAIWRKAFSQRNDGSPPIRIKASNTNLAISMRQGMYRAIRPFRAGEEFDEELRQAADLFVVYLDKPDDPNEPAYIELRSRLALSDLERGLAELGLDEVDLLLTDEKMTGLNLQEFITGPDAMPEVERPSNPFYERD